MIYLLNAHFVPKWSNNERWQNEEHDIWNCECGPPTKCLLFHHKTDVRALDDVYFERKSLATDVWTFFVNLCSKLIEITSKLVLNSGNTQMTIEYSILTGNLFTVGLFFSKWKTISPKRYVTTTVTKKKKIYICTQMHTRTLSKHTTWSRRRQNATLPNIDFNENSELDINLIKPSYRQYIFG